MKKIYTKGEVKALKEGEFEVIASTFDKDRMGDRINPDGWVLKNFKKNPVMLWAHNNFLPPVAKATKIWVEDRKLKLRGEFADTPLAQELKTLLEGGFLNAVSVGFIALEADEKGNVEVDGKMYRRVTEEEIKSNKDFWGDERIFEKQELLEVSWVAVPALPQALVTARQVGLELPIMQKAFEVQKSADPLSDDFHTREFNDAVIQEEIKNLKTVTKEEWENVQTNIIKLQETISDLKEMPVKSDTATENKGRKLEQPTKRNAELIFLRTLDKLVESRLSVLRKQK